VRKLIVGATGDHRAVEVQNRIVIQDATQRARGQHVDGRLDRPARRHPACAQLLGQATARRVDVRHDQPRTLGSTALCDAAADLAEADDRDGPALQRRRAEHALAACSDAHMDAERGEWARIARPAEAARQASDVRCPSRDQPHVPTRRADVLRGDVGAAERLDQIAEVKQRGAAPARRRACAGRKDDYALAAAERQVGHRCLERHRTREAQRVSQRRAGIGVAPHSATTERRATCARVDGHDFIEARARPAPDDHLFVVKGLEVAIRGGGREGVFRQLVGVGVVLVGSVVLGVPAVVELPVTGWVDWVLVVVPVSGVGAAVLGPAALMPPAAVAAVPPPDGLQDADCVCPSVDVAGVPGTVEFDAADPPDAVGAVDAAGPYMPVSPTPRGPCPGAKADLSVFVGSGEAVAGHALLVVTTELLPAVPASV